MGFNARAAAAAAWGQLDAPKKAPPPLVTRGGPNGSVIAYRHDTDTDVLQIRVEVKSFVPGVDTVCYGRSTIKKGEKRFTLVVETEYQARKVTPDTHNEMLRYIARMVEELHGHPILYLQHPKTSLISS